MKKKIIYLTFLFFVLVFSSYAQNTNSKNKLTGEWKGKITQNEGGIREEYNFELYLVQNGNKITGRSYAYFDDVYVIIELKGSAKSGTVVLLEELKIVEHRKYENMEWCIKKMQLIHKYEGDEAKLEGFWQGKSAAGECIPGKIYLTKQILRV